MVAPILLLAEVAGAVSRRYGDPSLGHQAKRTILELPDLRLIDIDHVRGELSADLASNLRLRGSDATYVALAQESNLALVTWDDEVITRAMPMISVFAPTVAPRSP